MPTGILVLQTGETVVPKLEVITGKVVHSQFKVDKPDIWIGSDERCDIELQEPGISRFHAQIVCDDAGFYWIKDAGSSFGTLINGRDVECEQLREHDQITLGRIKLRFVLSDNDNHSSNAHTADHRTAPKPSQTTNSSNAFAWLSGSDLSANQSSALPSLYPQTNMSEQHILTSMNCEHIPSISLQSEGCEIIDDDDDFDEVDDEIELLDEDLESSEEDDASLSINSSIADHNLDQTVFATYPLPPPNNAMNLLQNQPSLHRSTHTTTSIPAEVYTDNPLALLQNEPLSHQPSKTLSSTPASAFASVSAQAIAERPLAILQSKEPQAIVPRPQSKSENADDYADLERELRGEQPERRSRTAIFNIELENLRQTIQQRDQQLDQLQAEIAKRFQDNQQLAWLQRTLQLYREDNERLQYQLLAYEQAAEENETLMLRLESLMRENHQLREDNRRLQREIAEYRAPYQPQR
jgi:pSer/pThr/pTyr-binding forkhead associated (FHA) protein